MKTNNLEAILIKKTTRKMYKITSTQKVIFNSELQIPILNNFRNFL